MTDNSFVCLDIVRNQRRLVEMGYYKLDRILLLGFIICSKFEYSSVLVEALFDLTMQLVNTLMSPNTALHMGFDF